MQRQFSLKHTVLKQIFICKGMNFDPYLTSNTKINLKRIIDLQIWKIQQWSQDWKRSVFIPIPKKGNAKECSKYHEIALISHAIKVLLKILQARLQQYVNHILPYVQAGFRKGRGTRDQIVNIAGSTKKQENSRKTSTFVLLTMPKPLTMWTTTNCGIFFKRWEYQTT